MGGSPDNVTCLCRPTWPDGPTTGMERRWRQSAPCTSIELAGFLVIDAGMAGIAIRLGYASKQQKLGGIGAIKAARKTHLLPDEQFAASIRLKDAAFDELQ